MRVKGITLQQIVLGLALLAALCWNLAQANEIKSLHLSADISGTRAEVHLQEGDVPLRAFALDAPDRFVLDLPGVTAVRGLQFPSPAGVVKSVRSGRPAPDTLRLVFDLSIPATQIKPRLVPAADGPRLILEWSGGTPAPLVNPISGAVPPVPDQPLQSAASPPVNPQVTAPATGAMATAASVSPTGVLTAAPPVATPPPATAAPVVAAPAAGVSTAAVLPAATNPPPAGGAAKALPGKPLPSPNSPVSPTAVSAVRPQPPAASVGMTATDPDETPTAAVEPALPATPGKSLQDLRVGTRPLIIAIDAGHGGQDPGAIGPTGKREKDVTLAIARELARQINATPGLKAVLTRDTDVFLPLTRRPQIARMAKADMFVSIHADAAENRAAKGSSVYVLSLRGASSQRARWLADKENAADLIGGGHAPKSDDMLTSVLLDLTQSGQMKASEHAAAQILTGLGSIGPRHKPQVERANFAVLRTSDMPAMLVETAFISNPEEEKRLNDPAHQRKLARAVLDGVHAYFSRQPPPGTLYAARAKAQDASPALTAKAPSLVTGGSP